MDESLSQPAGDERMTPQESYLTEIEIFQEFVSKTEITKQFLIKGWDHYWHFARIRQEINSDKPPEERAEAPIMLFEAADKRLKLLRGEKIYLTKTQRNAYRALFIGDTLGTILAGGELGILLRGLTDKKLENAKQFCQAINKVGLEPNDIDKLTQTP